MPYNHTAASLRAVTLGKAVQQAGVDASLQGAAYIEAFTQSFVQQNGTFQGLYGGFTVAVQTLIAAQAANQSVAFDAIFAKVKYATALRLCCTLVSALYRKV